MKLVAPYQEDAAFKNLQDERRAGNGAVAVAVAWILVAFQQWYEGADQHRLGHGAVSQPVPEDKGQQLKQDV